MPTKMLNGTYYQTIDVKGRMSFPTKLREIIGESFVITKGLTGCLFVYSQEDFDKLAQKLSDMPMSKALTVQRYFMASSTNVEADKQGRVLVPQALREFAGLEKEIVVAGVSDRAEIWSKSKWDEFNQTISEEAVMEALEGLDF